MLLKDIKRCSRCILSETFPNIVFDEHGICNYCKEFTSENSKTDREQLTELFNSEIEKNKGKGEYDCIVAFSGGKDSSYTLMHLVKHHKLNCLAVTIDNGFISDRAIKNCYAVTDALGVDFVLFRPAPNFMMNMYKVSATKGSLQGNSSIKRASDMCSSCINLINNHVIKVALMHNASLVAGGYIGGQVPRNSAALNLNLILREKMKEKHKEKYKEYFGESANKFFFIHESLLDSIGNKTISIINPMLTLSLTEEEVISSIKPLGWVPTTDTGMNSTNCKLNDLGVAVHYEKYKFHPYEFEVAEQVRSGLMKREEGLKKINQIPERKDLDEQIKKIGLTL